MPGSLERECVQAPHLCTLPELSSYLREFVKAQERAGAPTNVVLVTYNRVGGGLFETGMDKGGLRLELYQGQTAVYVTDKKVTELVYGQMSLESLACSTPEKVSLFFQRIQDELGEKITCLEAPTFFVIYAGDGEKLELALNLVNNLSSLAEAVGVDDKVKFYLLTCQCNLAEKANKAAPLYSAGKLRYLAYNPSGECGGFADLETIRGDVLDAISKK